MHDNGSHGCHAPRVSILDWLELAGVIATIILVIGALIGGLMTFFD